MSKPRLVMLVGTGLVLSALAGPRAWAQAPKVARSQLATEAFKSCREQQKLGDASACYKLWISKWKEVGNVGEVAYAEEHTEAPAPAPAPAAKTELPAVAAARVPPVAGASFLTIKNLPAGAHYEVDGEAKPATSAERIPVESGNHAVRVIDADGVERTHDVVVKPGETAELDVGKPTEGAKVEGDAASGRAQPPVAISTAKGTVLDFCALKPKENTGKFEKQRVVLYAASDAEQIDDDEKIREAHGGAVLREVFAGRFPLARFHNVASHASAPKAWVSRESIPLAELSRLSAAEPSADEAATKRAVAEDEFVRYSLGCADYVALPVISSHEAKWEEREVKDAKGNTRKVKTLRLDVAASLGIFKRDGASFRRIAQLDASVPSFVDLATDAASMTAAAASSSMKVGGMDLIDATSAARELPHYLSAIPAPGCLVGKAATDGIAGLASCGPKGDGSTEAAFGNLDERLGPVCRKAMSGGAGDAQVLFAECEVRARAFQLSRSLQKAARGVDGWRLFGVLSATMRGRPAFSLGQAEGIRVGYAFQVIKNGERVGFYKVTDVGPGGDAGEGARSVLAKRSGDAPSGSRLEEWPQTGIVIQPFASAGLLTVNSAQSIIRNGNAGVAYEMPSAMIGGGLRVGYDLSSVLSWTETFVRLSGSAYLGSGVGTSVQLFPVEAFFEKGFFLGPRVTLTTGLGGGVQFVNATFKATGVLKEDVKASGTVFGPAARLGLAFMLHPDWSLDLEGFARVPVSPVSYAIDGDQAPLAELQRRADHFALLGVNLGVTRTF